MPRPWDSPGKNTGVGCHFLLQCMKVKSESEVAQSCPTLSDPMDCNLPGSSIHGIFQARVLEWGAIAFSEFSCSVLSNSLRPHGLQHARLPCPSPTAGAYSNSCPLSWWCHPTISSSVVLFSSHLQSFPTLNDLSQMSKWQLRDWSLEAKPFLPPPSLMCDSLQVWLRALLSPALCARPPVEFLEPRQWHPTPVLLPGKIPWTEEPGRLQSMGSRRVGHDWATSLSLFTFMHWRRKWQPVLAWRIPGMGESGGLPSMGSHRVGHDWSDLAAAAAKLHSYWESWRDLVKYISPWFFLSCCRDAASIFLTWLCLG